MYMSHLYDQSHIMNLMRMMQKNKFIHTLCMEANDLGIDNIKLLSDALSNNTNITHFRMQMNCIGPQEMLYISRGLKINSRLQYIDLSNNNLGDYGIQYLATAFKTNSSITAIDISQNNISHRGVKYLAKGLELNIKLICINLMGNAIEDNGVEYIAQIIDMNNVTHINLGATVMTSTGIVQLSNILKFNSTIQNINVRGNEVDSTIVNDFNKRNYCIEARNRVYQIMLSRYFCDHILCDSRIILHIMQFMLIASSLTPSCLYTADVGNCEDICQDCSSFYLHNHKRLP